MELNHIRTFFHFLVPGLIPLSLLESELDEFGTVTQLADTGKHLHI
jgi:hypothetical protein